MKERDLLEDLGVDGMVTQRILKY